jgi:hypothetical protein
MPRERDRRTFEVNKEETVDETLRMLAREYAADLEREAQNRRLARLAGPKPARERAPGGLLQPRRLAFRFRRRWSELPRYVLGR